MGIISKIYHTEAMEGGPFIDDLPIKNSGGPVRSLHEWQ